MKDSSQGCRVLGISKDNCKLGNHHSTETQCSMMNFLDEVLKMPMSQAGMEETEESVLKDHVDHKKAFFKGFHMEI